MRKRWILTWVIWLAMLASSATYAADPVCSKSMSPTECAEAQISAIAKLFGEYKQEIARLDSEITSLKEAVSAANKAATEKPKATATAALKAQTFGNIYQNQGPGARLVIVTATNVGAGNTMYGNLSKDLSGLPTGAIGGGNALTTVARESFACNTCSASFTFLVPAGNYYNVQADGPNVRLLIWEEADLL
jgi:hypothetical protein